IPDTSMSGRRVARELTELIAHRGKPGMIVSDHVLSAEGNGADGQSLSVRQHALAA
ncbi:MAG: IS3 family transposase, partial [Mesorhizobium sp.]